MSRHLLSASRYEPWLLALSLAGACVSANDPLGSDGASQDAGAGEPACGAGHRPAMGSKVDLDRACIEESSVLGCSPEGETCGDAETIVRGSDGVLWWRSNTCVPAGFTALDNAEQQKLVNYPRCGATGGSGTSSTSECGGSGRQSCAVGECPHQANRLDEARGCWKKSESVGCTAAGSSCPPVVLYMRDEQGARWSFPSGCPLPGFTRVDEGEVPRLSAAQYCDPPMTSKPTCDQLGVEACRDDKRCKIARGIQHDPMRRCRWPGSVELACVDFSQGCSSVVTHASYADERVPSFQFSDSCIPPKYVSRAGGELVDGWSICPEAQK